MRFTIKKEIVKESLGIPEVIFPKYTTQLINLAGSNAAATRPKVVGQMSELTVQSKAKTLNEWNKRFQNSWPEISKQGFNSYFKRMWEYYFSYCEGGFKAKSIDISQFLLIK